jgi:hypothetical protein
VATNPPVGRYQPEMLDGSTGCAEWYPIPELQPVLDREDHQTELDAHALRVQVAKMNRLALPGASYRVRYVPGA